MATSWYDEKDLIARIKEVRRIQELMVGEEQMLLNMISSIRGKENHVITDNGKIIALTTKPRKKPTVYEQEKIIENPYWKVPAWKRGS